MSLNSFLVAEKAPALGAVESTGVDPPMSLNSRRFCGSTLCILFPLTVHPGQAVFVDTVFKAAMQTAGTYDAAGNLFWINFKC